MRTDIKQVRALCRSRRQVPASVVWRQRGEGGGGGGAAVSCIRVRVRQLETAGTPAGLLHSPIQLLRRQPGMAHSSSARASPWNTWAARGGQRVQAAARLAGGCRQVQIGGGAETQGTPAAPRCHLCPRLATPRSRRGIRTAAWVGRKEGEQQAELFTLRGAATAPIPARPPASQPDTIRMQSRGSCTNRTTSRQRL